MSTRAVQLHPEIEGPLFDPGESDREWFRDHPEALVRLRPQLPDEVAAMDSLAEMGGSGGLLRLGADDADGNPLPITWMVVVDLLRLAGLPHGPDGESGRTRLACPQPIDDAMGKAIAARAVLVAARFLPPPTRKQPKGRGFA